MPVTLESPYPQGPGFVWVKGNLHTHTRRSDGGDDPQTAVRAYAALGYDFLMLSDHDVLADVDSLDPCGMTLLRGNEVSVRGCHILDVGARVKVEPSGDRQTVIDAINRDSGFAVLCHPNWGADFNHIPYEELSQYRNATGVEIFNTGVDGGPGNGVAVDKWDRLLSMDRWVWGYANDDSHGGGQRGRGWNVVCVPKAGRRNPEAIVEALRRGACYASTGVRIRRIACVGPQLQVWAPDAEFIAIIGQDGAPLARARGAEIFFDATRTKSSYLRVQCYGSGAAMAWSQPIRVRGGVGERMCQLAAEKPVLRALRTGRPPRLTGRGDDPLWEQAEATTRFLNGATALEAEVQTEVRCLLHGDAVYLRVRCEEPFPEDLAAQHGDGDQGLWTDDSVEIFVDFEGHAERYVQAMANSAGSLCAVLCHYPNARDIAARAAGGKWERGWQVEVALSFAGLEASTEPGARWGLHVCRNRKARPGMFFWAWVGGVNHLPSRYGILQL